VILHGIDFQARAHCFRTKDVDFFAGRNYLVTIHPGVSRSIGRIGDICARNSPVLGEGPVALMHRIIDIMVDNYMPEVEKLAERLDALEDEVFKGGRPPTWRGGSSKSSRTSRRSAVSSCPSATSSGAWRGASSPVSERWPTAFATSTITSSG
jgi:Mg2+ and Co2+ transporter CorA